MKISIISQLYLFLAEFAGRQRLIGGIFWPVSAILLINVNGLGLTDKLSVSIPYEEKQVE